MIQDKKLFNLLRNLESDKALAYSRALDDDISVESVRFKNLKTGETTMTYIGTVYGNRVGTKKGLRFSNKQDARANAEIFVIQCKTVVKSRGNGGLNDLEFKKTNC